MVTLKTNMGSIQLELLHDKAPATVKNFLSYAESGHYNNTIFHRVMNDFMIQGGGFDADFNQKPTQAPIKNEADNGLSNVVGSVAMARLPDPHSATCQFFINVRDNAFLDYKNEAEWGYCVFAKVIAGMEVVNQMKAVATGSYGVHNDVPKETIIIESVEIEQD